MTDLISRAEQLENEAARLRFTARWGDDEAYWTANQLVQDWLRGATRSYEIPDTKLEDLILAIGVALIKARP